MFFTNGSFYRISKFMIKERKHIILPMLFTNEMSTAMRSCFVNALRSLVKCRPIEPNRLTPNIVLNRKDKEFFLIKQIANFENSFGEENNF